MSLKYEPFSEPLHNSAFLNRELYRTVQLSVPGQLSLNSYSTFGAVAGTLGRFAGNISEMENLVPECDP